VGIGRSRSGPEIADVLSQKLFAQGRNSFFDRILVGTEISNAKGYRNNAVTRRIALGEADAQQHSLLFLHFVSQLHDLDLYASLALMFQNSLIRFAMLWWTSDGVEVVTVVLLLEIGAWRSLADLKMS